MRDNKRYLNQLDYAAMHYQLHVNPPVQTRKKPSLYRSIPKPLQIGVTDQDLSQAYLYNPRYSKAMGIKITPLPEGTARKKGAAPNEKEKASLMRHIA